MEKHHWSTGEEKKHLLNVIYIYIYIYIWMCMCTCACMYVCMFVCVWQRERERDRVIEGGMEWKCVCVRVWIVSHQCWTTLMQPSKKNHFWSTRLSWNNAWIYRPEIQCIIYFTCVRMTSSVFVLYLVHVHAIISLFHIKNRPMHTFIINTTSSTLHNTNNSDMFHPSKGYLQGVWQIRFNSKVNKMCYQI
jgi:hypothetical protein